MPNPKERFADRHIGPRPDEIEKMLATVGVASLDDLIRETIPGSILDTRLDLPNSMTEPEVAELLRSYAAENRVVTSLIGLGYHDSITPPVIKRNVLENPAWYTAYTPYQPEISQGRLEALLNFQTVVSDLTGLEVSNSSLLDEPTAAAEAMAMARRLGPSGRDVLYIDDDCHIPTVAVVKTRAEAVGVEVRMISEGLPLEKAFGVLLQYPGSSGAVVDHGPLIDEIHGAGALAIVATDLLSLALMRPPGEMGADIAIGSAQRFGVPLGYGGPHAGFITTKESMVRALPGRLVGVAKDDAGRLGYRLALQTREQHIRREKATSNVCTAQVLLAVVAGLYAAWHGPDGLRRIAGEVHRLASSLAETLRRSGLQLVNETWFDTLTVSIPGDAAGVTRRALDLGVNLGAVDDDHVRIALDETTDTETLHRVAQAFGIDGLEESTHGALPASLIRGTEFMTHPVFSDHQSEHEMLRYLRRLADRDLALDRSMIPLGSCTMKLNATTEMVPMTWGEFADIHPYAPTSQASGTRRMIRDLAADLAEITGYYAVSLQPNAGSQGELAGLLAIRAYHRSRGEERDVCLIPASAHGTNAASAVMAGMTVVVVATDETGNVDLDDLERKAELHSGSLAAAMVTYPSTHGVFEEGITRLAEIVHRHGGQVYIDGANLNAMVGLARPAAIGADVGHLNLHKTFTIPHGGGGPGVGPVGVRSHLAPFLPNHPLDDDAGPPGGIGPISGAPFGSAGVLPIPLAYLRLMGADGLRDATRVAILSANYIARRLDPFFPVLYTGKSGRVAHECILDLRAMTRSTGVTAEDVAKRLADYGLHAPTLSFPVPGTLMVEPTESEGLRELDRFCDAMIAIHAEARKIETGEWPGDDNPLKNAPHPAAAVASSRWHHPYTREQAAFPVPGMEASKYWPPVGRIDGAGGDRNLVCACPPLESYT